MLEGARHHVRDQRRLRHDQPGSHEPEGDHSDQEAPRPPGIAQQPWIDWFHVKHHRSTNPDISAVTHCRIPTHGRLPTHGRIPRRPAPRLMAQCPVSSMCWVPIRLRNTQYVHDW
ncbi:hypothetical protein Sm713_58020 [Streptomyces sp. TS71-3]|nr:hypothetical protein Sm713_58020 [Streptomyces sp. TS71-3]